jgi:hypothetical protein
LLFAGREGVGTARLTPLAAVVEGPPTVLSRIRLGLLVLATTLSVLLGLPSPSHAAPARPKVGQCHQLSWARAMRYDDPKAPVACGKRHNMQTLAVVTSRTSLAGLTEEQLSVAEDACFKPYWKAMGRLTKLRQTAYSLFTFVPTEAERAAGARWIRCDVALLHGDRRLASLPRPRLHRPVLRGTVRDSVRLCLTTGGRAWTTCDRSHRYRSTKAFVLHQTPYPTVEQVSRAASSHCRDSTAWLTWPSQTQWRLGNHVAVCYDKTKK